MKYAKKMLNFIVNNEVKIKRLLDWVLVIGNLLVLIIKLTMK